MGLGLTKRYFFPFLYLLFALFVAYAVQDFQTSKNAGVLVGSLNRGGVHQALFSILLVLGSYFALTHLNGRFIKSPVRGSLWLILGWVAVVNLLQGIALWNVAIHMGLCSLWILTHYFFSRYLRRHPESWPQVEKCILAMFLFYIFTAFYAANHIREIFGRVAVLNLAYSVLVFLPWVTLMEKRKRWIGTGIILLVVLFSMKRGAILVFPFMLGTAFFVETLIRNKSLKSFLKFITLLFLFFGGLTVADHWSGGLLSERFSSEQLASGSGRSVFYQVSLENIAQRSPWDLFIGLGSGSSVQFLGTGVHNEWLEFLFSFGVVGAFLYGLFILTLISRARRLIQHDSPYAPAYAMAITYMVIVGMFGGIYFVHSTLFVMAFFGVVEGLTQTGSGQEKLPAKAIREGIQP